MSTIPESPGVLPESIAGFDMPTWDMPELNVNGYNVLETNLISGPFHGIMKVILNVCGKIINALSRPLLEILVDILRAVIDLVSDILHNLLYFIQEILLNIIGYLEVVARFLLGIDDLPITGTSSKTIWEHMFATPTITKLFFSMIVLALPITFLITFWKMVPKISEEDTEQPVSVIARRLVLAIFRMLSIPAACMIMLSATIALIQGVRATSTDYRCGLPDAIFVALFTGFSRLVHIGEFDIGYSTFDGIEGSSMIDVGGVDNRETLIRDYMDPSNDETDHWRAYNNNVMVTVDFENPGIAWLVIFYTECKCISALLGFILSAAKQGLRLIVIFVYGPLITALSVDDAEMFDRYKRMFFAQFFSFLGAVLSLAAFYAVILSMAKLNVTYSTYREVDGIVRCTVVMVLVLCLDEVADMVTTLISGVHSDGYAQSTREMARVGNEMYGTVRRVTVGAARKVVQAGLAVATGGTSLGASVASNLGSLSNLRNLPGDNNGFGPGNSPSSDDRFDPGDRISGNGNKFSEFPNPLNSGNKINNGELSMNRVREEPKLPMSREGKGPELSGKVVLNAANELWRGNIDPAMRVAEQVVKKTTGSGMSKEVRSKLQSALNEIAGKNTLDGAGKNLLSVFERILGDTAIEPLQKLMKTVTKDPVDGDDDEL